MLSVVVQHELSSLVVYSFTSGAGKRKLSYVLNYVLSQVFLEMNSWPQTRQLSGFSWL